MRKTVYIIATAVILTMAGVVVAHHAAQGIVDDDIYAMIDAIVADTDQIFDAAVWGSAQPT